MSGATTDQRPAKTGARRRLSSWKEIATYLQSGVRTVRRWESQEGLPVRRHLHGKRGTVYAFAHDIDAWLEHRSVSPDAIGPDQTYNASCGNIEIESVQRLRLAVAQADAH